MKAEVPISITELSVLIRVSATSPTHISPTNCIIVPFRLLNGMHCLTTCLCFQVQKRRSDSNQINHINITKLSSSLNLLNFWLIMEFVTTSRGARSLILIVSFGDVQRAAVVVEV